MIAIPAPGSAFAAGLLLLAPGVTTCHLTAFNGRLRANGNKILIAVLVAAGAILAGNGIYGLTVG